MDIAILIEFTAKYVMLPLCTIVCTLGWYMFKKQDERMDALEKKVTSTEKEVIELRMEIRKDIQYIASDIKDIKQMLKNNDNRGRR
jgi:hypothetical protein